MTVAGRRRGAAAAVVALVVVAVLLARGCGAGPQAPATGAATLVPAGALVYVHVSTDGSRAAVARAARIAASFPSFNRIRDALLRRLSPAGAPVDPAAQVRPWLGREAALALLDTGGATAGSLVVLDVSDPVRARAFFERGAPQATGSYRGVRVESAGQVSIAFPGHYAVIGPADSVRAAIDLHAGRGPSLASSRQFRDATSSLPAGRVADAYLTAAGVRRLVAPQGGLLGVAGTLLDKPALRAAGVALSPAAGGVRVLVHELSDPALERSAGTPFRSFAPALADSVPGNALAYVGVAGLDRALLRLVSGPAGAGAAGPAGAALGTLLGRARGTLGAAQALALAGTLRSLFGQEVAIWVTPASGPPVLAVMSAAPDEARARSALAGLQQPLERIFAPAAGRPGQAPTFSQARSGSIELSTLRLAPGLELDWAVGSHRLVLATGSAPVLAALAPGRRLSALPAFHAALAGRPERVGSLLFLDFRALLALGEQTGLSSSAAYARVRGDLMRVGAVGESSSGTDAQSTAEIFVSIP